MSEDDRKPRPTLVINMDGSEDFWFKGKMWDPSFQHLVSDLQVFDLRQIAQAHIDDSTEEEE